VTGSTATTATAPLPTSPTWLNNKILGSGFIASFVDYNNDGDLDIYLVNDEFIHPIGNALWRNDGPGCGGWCFTDVSAEANANTRVMGMGLAIFDYENNGHFDFYFTNAGPMTLLQNQGDGTFVNVAVAAGVHFPTASPGARSPSTTTTTAGKTSTWPS
jgi:enediyne biosynthesis protein E4